MIILGIDPGLATLGYGVVEVAGTRQRALAFGVLTTPPDLALPRRLCALFEGVERLMDQYAPDEVAVEELFFSKNVTTGIAVASARGAALAALARRTEKLYEYTPMQVKQAVTGHGKADKRQMQTMVKMLLGMAEIARPDDAADALAVAIAHAGYRKMENLSRM
ncbi:MAG: crossover junction endodeoxyribonuclease RuvC [Clostridiales bacterium]|nr:crossover junction endodeoxyribonuclease RuvC [Clostridiales bacterium]